MAKNYIVKGDYEGCFLSSTSGKITLHKGFKKIMNFDKTTVSKYELITSDISKSATSGVARGIVGGALLGPVGLLAGGLSAKNKGLYYIEVEFIDGKKSLATVDKRIYNDIIKTMF